MSTIVSMNNLLEAGVHFGHQRRRWNPKMGKYIYTTRDDIYIIDLAKTVKCLEEAYDAMKKIAEDGGQVLFVGTKKQAQEAAEECAERVGMYFVNERWLGGTLTNFKTIRSRIKRMDDIDKMESDGTFDLLPKKEVIKIRKEYEKLNKNLRGIREMTKIPQALVIVDPRKEENAIKEARILGIPVFGVVDTNCDPDLVDFVIPGNDDAIRAVKVVLGVLTNAIAEVNGKEVLDYVTEEEKSKKQIKKSSHDDREEAKERVENKTIKEEVVEENRKSTNLDDLTLAELKAMAKDKGVKGYSAMKKQELIDALN